MRLWLLPALALTALAAPAQTMAPGSPTDPQNPTPEELGMPANMDEFMDRFIICPGNPRCPPTKPKPGPKEMGGD